MGDYARAAQAARVSASLSPRPPVHGGESGFASRKVVDSPSMKEDSRRQKRKEQACDECAKGGDGRHEQIRTGCSSGRESGTEAQGCRRAIDAVVDDLGEIGQGEEVSIIGFGTFSVKSRAERVGRNPRTGESITIAAAKTPVFKPGKALKDAV